jgi:hypothetical protein
MDKKTVGIIATVATALLCGCPGLFLCLFGILMAAGAPVTTTLNGQTSSQTYPPTYGYVMLCLSLLLILIPIVVGFLTLRKKPESAPAPKTPNEPIPPAS